MFNTGTIINISQRIIAWHDDDEMTEITRPISVKSIQGTSPFLQVTCHTPTTCEVDINGHIREINGRQKAGTTIMINTTDFKLSIKKTTYSPTSNNNLAIITISAYNPMLKYEQNQDEEDINDAACMKYFGKKKKV